MPNAVRDERALTLFDSMLTLFLLAALVVSASYPAHLFLGDKLLRQGAHGLLLALDREAERAMVEQREVVIHFDLPSDRVAVLESTGKAVKWRTLFEFKSGLRLSRARFGSLRGSSDDRAFLRLYPDGSASPGSVTLIYQ